MTRPISLALLLVLFGSAVWEEDPVTIFLAGDSTMAEKREDRRPETGWGEVFAGLVDEDDFEVENHARNGRSTRTFLEERRWHAIVQHLSAGDYVFIQFGHNDASPDKPDRYTPPEVYRANLMRFVEETRARDALPVLMTPVVRRRFDDRGQFYDSHGEYPEIVREVAAEEDVPLIDMERMTRALLIERGMNGSKELFLHLVPGEHTNYPDGLEDDTHFSPLGARLVAEIAYDAFLDIHRHALNK